MAQKKVTLTFTVEQLNSVEKPTQKELKKSLAGAVVGQRFTVMHDLPDNRFVGIGHRVTGVVVK